MSLVKRLIHRRDRTVPREWTQSEMGWVDDALPPDLTVRFYTRDLCPSLSPTSSYICTRMLGHEGRHAAGNSRSIVAVWA